jgi:DNA-cytosine methyltransferase
MKNVLSLFNGMSCLNIALARVGIGFDKYYSAEIDKYAIQVTQGNYPDTIQVGDVTKWREWDIDWSSIDLVTGGFPCQAWSMAGKQLGDKDERGMLFWVMLDIMKHVRSHNPKAHFLIENVKMKREFEEYITHYTTDALGVVHKILINSALVSAQNRNRYYWTSFECTQPDDREIALGDILEREPESPTIISDKFCNRNAEILRDDISGKAKNLSAMEYVKNGRQGDYIKCGRVVGRKINPETGKRDDYSQSLKIEQRVEPRLDDKSGCLTTVQKDNVVIIQRGRGNNPGGIKAKDGKTPTLSANSWEYNNHLTDGVKYRKLTPVECERLQTVLQYIKPVEIVLCLDQAKSFVSAVEKNPKLLKLVSSAGSEELKECAKLASQNMNASKAPTKYTAHQDVGMRTQMQTRQCTITNHKGLNLIVSNAESTTMCKQAGSAENSAIQSVFIDITEGRITHYGKEELLQIEQSYTERMNGKIALNLFGGEMMLNAKNALSALEMMQTNQHSTSITSFRLSTKNLEQMLTISYWFAKSAIGGSTQDTISKKTIYLNLIDGYTNHVSDSQRYKMLGNGWTVDVIAHILRCM